MNEKTPQDELRELEAMRLAHSDVVLKPADIYFPATVRNIQFDEDHFDDYRRIALVLAAKVEELENEIDDKDTYIGQLIMTMPIEEVRSQLEADGINTTELIEKVKKIISDTEAKKDA